MEIKMINDKIEFEAQVQWASTCGKGCILPSGVKTTQCAVKR